MSAFLQTEDGDLALQSNRMQLCDGKTQLKQALLARLRVFRGEWFLDLQAGTPYFEQILGKNNNPGGPEGALKEVITQTPGVRSLQEFSFELDRRTRVAAVSFTVDSDFGPLSLQEEIP
jgi:hypothetical protein